MSERREHFRHEVWFPVEVEVPDGTAVAVSYDLSTSGLLMAAGGRLDIGAEVTVTFKITRDAPEQKVRGRIVRVERNPPSVDSRWLYKLALEFEEPQPEIETLLKQAGG